MRAAVRVSGFKVVAGLLIWPAAALAQAPAAPPQPSPPTVQIIAPPPQPPAQPTEPGAMPQREPLPSPPGVRPFPTPPGIETRELTIEEAVSTALDNAPR
ncbi:MAG TPA: hypothetical protein VFN71_06980, partial [Methylomirabilota bacterium]|nr:hypothetical protein [Methylomirabilota bacterium]